MTSIEQMEKWVEGESIHNGERSDPMSECCPDFSCCNPGMKWSTEKRKEFAKAMYDKDESKKMSMLGEALGQLLEYNEIRKVHIVK